MVKTNAPISRASSSGDESRLPLTPYSGVFQG
jgi:hypothetical protein